MISAIIPIHDRTLAFSVLHGTPLIQHMVNALLSSRVLTVVLVFDANTESISLPWFNGKIFFNNRAHHTLSSLNIGIEALRTADFHGVLICPVTTPLLSQSLIVDVLQGFWQSRRNIVIPVCYGKQGHPVLIATPLFDDLKRASSFEDFLETHQDDRTEITTEEGAFRTISSASEIESLVL
ncbi:MAG TPA: NTP transferase domain-containing protein [Bacteroidota bacterium]|nr:NTP transferase domain-containing protein [Bacteroidota bacterium]